LKEALQMATSGRCQCFKDSHRLYCAKAISLSAQRAFRQ